MYEAATFLFDILDRCLVVLGRLAQLSLQVSVSIVSSSSLPTSMPPHSALQYRRKWSQKNDDLKALSYVSFSQTGKWLAVSDGPILYILDADNGCITTRMACPIRIVAMQWVLSPAVVCCREDGTIMTVSLQSVGRNRALTIYCIHKLQAAIVVDGTTARDHRISEMALGATGELLATGSGFDIRVWRRKLDGEVRPQIARSFP